ncbi:MAG: purine-binding chemotaxis protein CheW [Nitrospirae bacterium]|nr:purine-binding chemotaxis protein CheW [Nitrospirota bacterium]
MKVLEKVENEIQFLIFSLSGVEYGVNIAGIKEIIRVSGITKVPSTPPCIRGVINLRGSVIPIVDLPVKFGISGNPQTNRTCIIILEVDYEKRKTPVGMMVDRVNEVIKFSPEEIDPPPSFGTPIQGDFLTGLGKRKNQLVLILAIDKILSIEELKSGFPVIPEIDNPIRPSA